MGKIQQDITDVYSREMAPMISEITRSMLDELSIEDRREASKQIDYLDGFQGEMSAEKVAPTVYMYWLVSFFESFFQEQIQDDFSDEAANLRQLITSNFGFNDFYMRLIHEISKDSKTPKYAKFC